jgi:outer membrane murein-binding lipoprotein Lpp
MKPMILVCAAAIGGIALLSGCQSSDVKYEKYEAQAKSMPVNCATAQGDIRMLRSEKVNAEQQAAAGVTSIVPVGAVVGLIGGTEGTQVQIATGEYNQILDKKIAEIQSTCGVQ